jgi:hypothetical protein
VRSDANDGSGRRRGEHRQPTHRQLHPHHVLRLERRRRSGCGRGGRRREALGRFGGRRTRVLLPGLRAGSEGAGAREACSTHTLATLVGAKARAKARGDVRWRGGREGGGREARRRCGEGRLLLRECGRGVADDVVDGRHRGLELQPAALSDELRRGQRGHLVGVHAHVDAGATWIGLGIHDVRGSAAARTVITSAPRGTKIVKVEARRHSRA